MHPYRRLRAPGILSVGLLAFACQRASFDATEAVASARGRELYGVQCSQCHGARGDGNGPASAALFPRPRDFTTGVFERASTQNGVPTEDDLVAVLRRGWPGSAMPAWSWMPDSDLRALASVVRQLAVEGMAQRLREEAGLELGYEEALALARERMTPGPALDGGPDVPRAGGPALERLVQERVTVRVRRVDELDLMRTEWEGVEEVEFALAPLWWRDDAVFRASVSALHDGETLALRVRWSDPTADSENFAEPPLEAPLFADGLAVQFSAESEPPIFGMGRGSAPTNMWHWRAVGLIETESLAEAVTTLTHGLGDQQVGHPDLVPLYRAYRGPIWIEDRTKAVEVTGMNTLEEHEPLGARVGSFATWLDGRWEVVLARSMEARAPGIPLCPGDRLSISFAIWEGAGRDLRGQKSVTLWHALELDE